MSIAINQCKTQVKATQADVDALQSFDEVSPTTGCLLECIMAKLHMVGLQ